jgi:hypothetical protein
MRTYSSVILGDSPVAYWPLWEATGMLTATQDPRRRHVRSAKFQRIAVTKG